MNFLAHLYLSGNDDDILIGNFIADSVKGSALKNYTDPIQEGIILHRKIDAFTDSHPVVLKGKVRLRPKYHKYAPVIMDVFYDHFLAIHWDDYSEMSLTDYVSVIHGLLDENKNSFPERSKMMLPYMIKGNWLLGYSGLEGINRSLSGMARRTNFKSDMEFATKDLARDYELYEEEFQEFFPLLIDYVKSLGYLSQVRT
ncbi:MAG: hypothetical protein COB85_05375 [Bacteroidetes bacterium]|nr:MAG: hypothetical protein COB85_05375 [Bacteroidota bacterium]